MDISLIDRRISKLKIQIIAVCRFRLLHSFLITMMTYPHFMNKISCWDVVYGFLSYSFARISAVRSVELFGWDGWFWNWWTQHESETDAESFGRKWEEWRIYNKILINDTNASTAAQPDADECCAVSDEFRLHWLAASKHLLRTSSHHYHDCDSHQTSLIGTTRCVIILNWWDVAIVLLGVSDGIRTAQLDDNTSVWSNWPLYFLTLSRTGWSRIRRSQTEVNIEHTHTHTRGTRRIRALLLIIII